MHFGQVTNLISHMITSLNISYDHFIEIWRNRLNEETKCNRLFNAYFLLFIKELKWFCVEAEMRIWRHQARNIIEIPPSFSADSSDDESSLLELDPALLSSKISEIQIH